MSEHHDCDHCGSCIKDDPSQASTHEIQVEGGKHEKAYFFDLCPRCSKKLFKKIDKFVLNWRRS